MSSLTTSSRSEEGPGLSMVGWGSARAVAARGGILSQQASLPFPTRERPEKPRSASAAGVGSFGVRP